MFDGLVIEAIDACDRIVARKRRWTVTAQRARWWCGDSDDSHELTAVVEGLITVADHAKSMSVPACLPMPSGGCLSRCRFWRSHHHRTLCRALTDPVGEAAREPQTLKRQRRNRKAWIRVDRGSGMTVLHAELDPITGERVRTVLSARTNQLWREEDPRRRPSTEQRMAAALAGLICGPDDRKKKPSSTTLLLIADCDIGLQQIRNARLGDGTPMPVEVFKDPACQARIVPAIFNTRGQPLWVGLGKRLATPAQRMALIAGTGDVWDAAPIRPGAKRTTLFPGRPTGPPTSTISVSCAADATTEYMTKDGKSNEARRRISPPTTTNSSRRPLPSERHAHAPATAKPTPNFYCETHPRLARNPRTWG